MQRLADSVRDLVGSIFCGAAGGWCVDSRSSNVRGSVRLCGLLGDRAFRGFTAVGVADGLGALLLLLLFDRIGRRVHSLDGSRFG